MRTVRTYESSSCSSLVSRHHDHPGARRRPAARRERRLVRRLRTGAPIRALYSSADGGITENVGCVLEAERPATTWQWSPGGRPISVRVYGTLASVDLKGDRFLRTTLGLKSTLVRTLPF